MSTSSNKTISLLQVVVNRIELYNPWKGMFVMYKLVLVKIPKAFNYTHNTVLRNMLFVC